jgi:hypothetical protein
MIAAMNFANTKIPPNRYLPDIAAQIVRSKDDGTRFLLPAKLNWVQSALSTRGEARGSFPTSRSRSPELKDPVAPGAGGRYAEGKSGETPNWSGPDKSYEALR